MSTTLGDAYTYDLQDDHYLDHLIIGSHIPTPANPVTTLIRDEHTKKAVLRIDRGAGFDPIIKMGDDCKHWTCTSDNDPLCVDPNP